MAENLGEGAESEEQYPVERVCSYCQKAMGPAEHTSNERGRITHGICPDCLKKERAKFEKIRQGKK